MSYQPSPFPRRSISSVAPFTVKRKQVNYDGLEMSSSQCSFGSLVHQNSSSKPEDLVRSIFEGKSFVEHTAKIQQLEKDLKDAVHEQQKWRHKCRLMETEREKFEASVQAQCEKDKELLGTELKILKQTHLSKVQDLSNTIGRLQKTIDALREQLDENGIVEELEFRNNEDEAIETILSRMNYREEAEFIKSAYQNAKSTRYGANRGLWSDIQNTMNALKHEVELFHAWRTVASVPLEDLIKVMRENDRPPTNSGMSAIRKALFGRKGSGKRK